MMGRIVFTNPQQTMGDITFDDGLTVGGPIPPLSAEFRPRYDALIAAGVAPEPYVPPTPAPAILRAELSAMANLRVSGDEISGIETATGLAAAMALEPHVFWVFFSAAEPDTNYIPIVHAPGRDADVTYPLNTDFIEITVSDRGTGAPAVPTQIVVSTQRVR